MDVQAQPDDQVNVTTNWDKKLLTPNQENKYFYFDECKSNDECQIDFGQNELTEGYTVFIDVSFKW